MGTKNAVSFISSGLKIRSWKNTSSVLPETFSTPEIRRETTDEEKFKIIERLRDFFSKEYKVVDIDGVRVIFDDGWGLVRASNTEPVLVLRFEAKSEARLEEIKKLVEGKLEELSR